MLYYNWQDRLKEDVKELMKSSSQAMDVMISPSAEQNFIKYLHKECPEVSCYRAAFSMEYNALVFRICKKEIEK